MQKDIKKTKKIKLEKENNKFKENIPMFDTIYKEWNNVYKCNSCFMYSRHYQLTYNSTLDKENKCPFCKGEKTLETVSDKLIHVVDDIPFSEKIEENEKKNHILSLYDKWILIENKEKEFREFKVATEVKIEQLKAYEKLKSTDLSEMMTTYEEKLAKNLQEMEDFKDSLLKDFY